MREASALSLSSSQMPTGAVMVVPGVVLSAASLPSRFAAVSCPLTFSAILLPLQPFDLTFPWPGTLSFRFLELFVALLWLYMCALDLIGCAATRASSSSILVGFL